MGVLGGVIDPELGSNIVELGMAKSASVDEDGTARITIALTTSGCPLRAQIQKDVEARVLSMPGVEAIKINWTELTRKRSPRSWRRPLQREPERTRHRGPVHHPMCADRVGQRAASASRRSRPTSRRHSPIQGYRVGVLDADIWGYSIPDCSASKAADGSSDSGKITPHVVSMGAGELESRLDGVPRRQRGHRTHVAGLMLNRAVQHFLQDVEWGDLDYLLIDMPPGTGDVQMGLAKMLPHAEMLVVTTPSKLAQTVAVRVANMGRNNYLRVAGVIENMSAFVDEDGKTHEVFGSGGGADLADRSTCRSSAGCRSTARSSMAATRASRLYSAAAPAPTRFERSRR